MNFIAVNTAPVANIAELRHQARVAADRVLESGKPKILTWNGEKAEDSVTGAAMGSPMISLAWLANLAAERGWPMRKDMIVITGSTLATKHLKPGDHAAYTIEGMGTVEVRIRA